jgi:hypothetical protein
MESYSPEGLLRYQYIRNSKEEEQDRNQFLKEERNLIEEGSINAVNNLKLYSLQHKIFLCRGRIVILKEELNDDKNIPYRQHYNENH